MPLGVRVQNRTMPPARGAPVDTGTAFLAAVMAVSGSTTQAKLITSMAAFEAEYGVRTTGGSGNLDGYDWADNFFREGGQRLYVARYTTVATGLAGALALFPKSLGPGQVAAPSETPGATSFGALLDHAAATNRVALLDVSNAATSANVTTLAGAIPVSNETYGALFGSWVTIPGQAGVVGAGTRLVPASSTVAGLCARADFLGNPNRAPAGRDFPLNYGLGFQYEPDDASTDTLLNAGANFFRTIYGVAQLYGFQTGKAENTSDPYWQFNVSRLRMALAAEAASIGESYMFRPIDGRGLLQASFKGDLMGMLKGYFEANALYGTEPEDAFAVEVGVSVNTLTTIAQGQMNAVAEIRPTMHAKSITIDLVTVPVTGNVSG